MQTALIIRALEILPAQSPDRPIIPPKEVSNDNVECPCTHHLTPDSRIVGHVERSHSTERRQRRLKAIPLALGDIHRNHDQTTNNAQENHDIATHLRETQKDGGIQSNRLDQLRFPRLDDRLDPGEETLAHRRRGVFLVCMFDLGRIDEAMARSEEGKEEGEEDGEAEGGAEGGPDGADCELFGGLAGLSIEG